MCSLNTLGKVLHETCQHAVELSLDDVPIPADLLSAVNSNAEMMLEWNIAQGSPSDLSLAIIETMHKYALNKGACVLHFFTSVWLMQ